jgi:hypothetical protein
LGIGSGLIGTVTHVNISAVTVSFFGLHSAIDQPKSMDMTGDVSENSETDIDQEVTAATGNERRCGWWKEDRYKDEADI